MSIESDVKHRAVSEGVRVPPPTLHRVASQGAMRGFHVGDAVKFFDGVKEWSGQFIDAINWVSGQFFYADSACVKTLSLLALNFLTLYKGCPQICPSVVTTVNHVKHLAKQPKIPGQPSYMRRKGEYLVGPACTVSLRKSIVRCQAFQICALDGGYAALPDAMSPPASHWMHHALRQSAASRQAPTQGTTRPV